MTSVSFKGLVRSPCISLAAKICLYKDFLPKVRLYDTATHSCLGSIPDRKENSERYLSPLALRQSKEVIESVNGASS